MRYHRLAAAALVTVLTSAAVAAPPEQPGAEPAGGAEGPLPDLFTALDGSPVRDADLWRNARRAELLGLFRTYVYGRAPVGRPDSLAFAVDFVDPKAMNGAATRKDVSVTFAGPGGDGRIRLALFVPNARTGPAPATLFINHRAAALTDPANETWTPYWPAERIVARGYAAAAFHVDGVDPDDRNDAAFADGVHKVFDPSPAGGRAGDAWATVAAWAWGLSRAMDYLETDGDVDAARVVLVGHSRTGKAALWAGAQDERFAMVVSNQSGSTGAALSRGKAGETVAVINDLFPHWFCANYKQYAGREADLPVDQHMLLALVAPRLLYVASAAEDVRSDPGGEFRATAAASPAWQLLGAAGLPPAAKMPAADAPLHGDRVAYHVRPGRHGLVEADWDKFLDFADARLPGAGK